MVDGKVPSIRFHRRNEIQASIVTLMTYQTHQLKRSTEEVHQNALQWSNVHRRIIPRRFPAIQVVYTVQVLIFILYLIFSGLGLKSHAYYRNMYLVFTIFVNLAQIGVILLGFAVGKSLSPDSDEQNTVKRVDGFKTFVIFSSLGVFAQQFTRIVVTCSSSYEYVELGLILTSNALSVIGVIYQIQFLFYCQMIVKKRGSRFNRKTFDAVLSFLAIFNFASWLVNSFLPNNKTSETDFYKLFAPFTLFFRFNSVIVFLKVYLKDNSHVNN